MNPGGAASAVDVQSTEAATKALGWKFVSDPYDAANPTAANSAVLSAVQAGAGGITVSGVPSQAFEPGIAAADAKHVPVALFEPSNPLNDHPGFYEVAQAESNTPSEGEVNALAIRATAQQAGETAHVGIVSSPGLPAIDLLVTAMKAGIQQYCPACSVALINVSGADLLDGKVAADIVAYVQAHPETNYVDWPLGGFEGGTRAALDGAGMRKVAIGGLVPSPVQNEELKSGADLFWVQYPDALVSWYTVDAIARALTGGNAESDATPPIPAWVVEKSNLTFSPATLPNFPLGYEAAFEKAWHVS